MNRHYLDARVTTASQPELQLMLLEGALRFARQAQQSWPVDASRGEVDRLLTRSIDIVVELIRSVSDRTTPIAARLDEDYTFMFRRLSTALVNHDGAALEAGIELLGYHRETWRQACQSLKPAAAAAPHLDAYQRPPAGLSLQA